MNKVTDYSYTQLLRFTVHESTVRGPRSNGSWLASGHIKTKNVISTNEDEVIMRHVAASEKMVLNRAKWDQLYSTVQYVNFEIQTLH